MQGCKDDHQIASCQVSKFCVSPLVTNSLDRPLSKGVFGEDVLSISCFPKGHFACDRVPLARTRTALMLLVGLWCQREQLLLQLPLEGWTFRVTKDQLLLQLPLACAWGQLLLQLLLWRALLVHAASPLKTLQTQMPLSGAH